MNYTIKITDENRDNLIFLIRQLRELKLVHRTNIEEDLKHSVFQNLNVYVNNHELSLISFHRDYQIIDLAKFLNILYNLFRIKFRLPNSFDHVTCVPNKAELSAIVSKYNELTNENEAFTFVEGKKLTFYNYGDSFALDYMNHIVYKLITPSEMSSKIDSLNKKEVMQKKIAYLCTIENEAQGKLLNDMAVMKGWGQANPSTFKTDNYFYLPKDKTSDKCSYTLMNTANAGRHFGWHFEKITVQQCLDILMNDKHPEIKLEPDPIDCGKIAGHKVTYVPNQYIKVGCATFKDKQIRELYKAYTATDNK
jgi:hypothetical protein